MTAAELVRQCGGAVHVEVDDAQVPDTEAQQRVGHGGARPAGADQHHGVSAAPGRASVNPWANPVVSVL